MTETDVAKINNGEFSFDFCILRRPQKNRISRIVSNFVFRSPCTVRYSHDLMPKKRAPITSCPIALSRDVVLFLHIVLNTMSGNAF